MCQGSRLQNTGLQDKKNGALGLHGCTLGLHVEKASGFGLQGKHFGATGTHWSYYGGGLTAIFGWSLLIILALQGFFFQILLFSYLYKTINLRLRLKQKIYKKRS